LIGLMIHLGKHGECPVGTVCEEKGHLPGQAKDSSGQFLGQPLKKDIEVEMISPKDLEALNKQIEKQKHRAGKDCGDGSYGGVGIMLNWEIDGSQLVTEVAPGSPADLAGIKPMDEIFNKQGVPRGPVGTSIDVEFAHSDGQHQTVTLIRDLICFKIEKKSSP
jgi:C-terminal processing protease CtpA/Prc